MKIPCELARDLFPSYIDGLTSAVSNELLEAHLEECEACREVLASMRGEELEQEETGTGSEAADGSARAPAFHGPEKKEIDFLKKNRRRNRRILLGSLAGALLLGLLIVGANLFVIGRKGDTSWAAMDLRIDGKEVSLEAVPTDSASAIAALTYTEEDGVVSITARSVLVSPLHRGDLRGSYQASEEIREVRIGDRIVWSEGATVSGLAAELFTLRHDFAGDMPANDRLAQGLSMPAYLGAYTNELETDVEPYGWKILLTEEISAGSLQQKERDMDAFGYVLVGLTGNLDHVTFVYTADGEERTRTVTAEDASAFLGEDIKHCMEDIRVLDLLVGKSGLSLYAVSGTQGDFREEGGVRIRNLTDTDLLSYTYSCYKDGVLCSSGGGMNADGSGTKVGEAFWDPVTPQEFGGSWDEDQLLEIEFGFERPDHTTFTVPERIRVSADANMWYDLTLTGSEEEGYHISR